MPLLAFTTIPSTPEADPPAGIPPLGWKTPLAALVSYLGALTVATYPYITSFLTNVPGLGDPLIHLSLMRWYRTCLLSGRVPFRCPDVHAPAGMPLGLDSPLHLESLFYLPLSLLTSNDALCYNIIWAFGFLGAGMATFLLAWRVLRHRACAWLAGLLAMLGTPMMLHAHGHFELIQVGGFPLFLLAWIRLVDRPGWGRLLAAAGLYLVVVMGAAYFAILTTFPAAWYVGWRATRYGWRGAWPWLRARVGWLLAFGAATAPGLLVLFSSQFWAAAHGVRVSRDAAEFDRYGTPLWSYVTPTGLHRLGRHLPLDVFAISGHAGCVIECGSYLGIVALALIIYAALNRVRFVRSGFWWSVFVLLVVLSLGSRGWIGTKRVDLPVAWFRSWFVPFHLIRVPARFNLLACICAAVLAAAGLRHLLGRIRSASARAALCAGLAGVAVIDLSMTPFGSSPIPPVPEPYLSIRRHAPDACLLEIPQFPSSGSQLGAIAAYWQAFHGVRTTAGYSCNKNLEYELLIYEPSPFHLFRMLDTNYLKNPDATAIDLQREIAYDDYVWLYLHAHHFDYVILHQTAESLGPFEVPLGSVKTRLAPALVSDDGNHAIYAADRLRPPTRPVLLCTEGWLQRRAYLGRQTCALSRTARMAVYQPDPDLPLTLTLETMALGTPRTARLLDGDRELARWWIEPGPRAWHTYTSPPLALSRGLHTLTLACDGEQRPRNKHEAADPDDLSPFSLRVATVGLAPARLERTAIRPEVTRRRTTETK
jgi:hypothetical protein